MKHDKSDLKDEWIVAEGKHDGHRIIVRQNVGVRSIAGDAHYPFRLGIAVPFIAPQKDGMPNEDELATFARIEDMIHDYFGAKHTGVLCIVITTQGMRELVSYLTTDDAIGLIESISRQFPEYDFQNYIERDEDWEVYKQWEL